MDPKFERQIEDIVFQLRAAKDKGRKCTLLIGAGCSVTAGIPTAHEIVEEIKQDYKRAYERAEPKDYAHCMEELVDGDRHDLIIKYIDRAKVNWAHMCIGLLIQNGYVDRVLTVNFDPLVARACALLREFPAIYDFAASKHFDPDRIPDKAVFHLHGQHTGFVHLHTPEDVEGHVDSFAPVFEDAGRNRTWIVVGYSGECDPVFKHLAGVKKFNRGLYWIGHDKNEPSKHVREELLISGKGAFYTKGYDADSFFIKLTRELKIFPPQFVNKPFTHLKETFADILPLILPDQSEDILSDTREKIEQAIKQFETGEKKTHLAEALRLSMAGYDEELVSFSIKHNLTTHTQLIEPLAWAYVELGKALYDQAKTKSGKEADKLFAQAVEKLQDALKIKPDTHDALHGWGIVLTEQAKTKTGKEADLLFTQAGEKFQDALKIKPDLHEALNNWGIALYRKALTKTGEEADELFIQAGKKYQGAHKIKPDEHMPLYNWGTALAHQAKTKAGKAADDLLAQAIKQFQAALKIKPDEHMSLYNWGTTLLEQSRTKTLKETDRLYTQAGEKYLAALKIKSNDPVGFFNMACLKALTGDQKDCQNWLEKKIALEPLTEEDINDWALDSMRELDWFEKLVAESKKKKE